MSKAVQVKEAVKETFVGSEEPVQASVQSKTRFNQYAAKDPQTGESFMGPEEFINAVAPINEDYHRVKREQFGMLFKVADRQNKGRISISDWVSFENLLNKSDAEYEIAFRLFDVERSGNVKYDDFRRLYELNKGPDSLAFDWDCEWAKLYIGSKKKRHAMDYAQFSQLLRGLQGERIRQAFLQFDKDGDGYIEPDDFERIILETTKHKLSDHVLENLSTLCNITQGSKVSYANVRAFQNMIKEIDLVELIVRRACVRSNDGKITRTEFLNQAAKITRFSLFTPMEADILFHFASLDEPSGRLGLRDFAKVLDPTWRSPSELASVGGAALAETKTKSAAVLSQIAESAYGFALGSIAGAFGAFMVYPIDLVKTRMQNQRKIIQKEMKGEKSAASTGQRVLYNNSIDCFKKTLRSEGVRGLYSGVVPQLIGVAPEKAIKLTVNDLVRTYFTDKTGHIAVPAEMLAGASAGICQVVFTNPLEIVKIRLQIQGEAVKQAIEQNKTPPPKQGAMWHISSLGIRGLYKGASACLARDAPFSAIYFPTYNHLKKDLFHESPTKKLGILQLLTAGAIAGMPAAYLTTPFDVIKTRLQVEVRPGQTVYTGLMHAARTIYAEEGATAFFKGGPARIMRSSPQFGFTLAAYEFLQRKLPYPGNKPASSAVTESLSTLREKFDASPLGRSRNALKIVLDIDENFGLARLPNKQAWKTLPGMMQGSN